jgi:hypothetical protein
MKKLPLPEAADDDVLQAIADRHPVADCPHLATDLATVKQRYLDYHSAAGNALAANAPQPITMPGLLQAALKNRYSTFSEDRKYISAIRDTSINICPMCGAPAIGTVDHVFPREHFAELAIFSKNLVPACFNCNTHRSSNYKGAGPDERVLHPYYDVRMDERLVRANISPVGTDFGKPVIDVVPNIPQTDLLYAAVTFHLKTVIRPAGIVNRLCVMWACLQRDQNGILILQGTDFSDMQFDQEVHAALARADAEFSCRNNWKSILLAGLHANNPAKLWLAQKIRRIRSGTEIADDV